MYDFSAGGFPHRKEKIIMEKFSESMKKIVLAGIGAVATTAEKSKEVVDDLIKKGELTVEQGKVLNEELKHNVKSMAKKEEPEEKESEEKTEDMEDVLKSMTPEQIAYLKEQLRKVESDKAKEAEGVQEEAAE